MSANAAAVEEYEEWGRSVVAYLCKYKSLGGLRCLVEWLLAGSPVFHVDSQDDEESGSNSIWERSSATAAHLKSNGIFMN